MQSLGEERPVMKTDTPRPIHLKDYKPPAYLIDQVDLDVHLHPTATRVTSQLKIRRNPAVGETSVPLELDGETFELEDIRLNGKKLEKGAMTRSAKSLTIAKPPAAPFTLNITTILNPEANKALEGLYRSRGVFCTQCEAEGFRRITYFIDRPDVLSTYTCRIEADRTETPILLANGNLVKKGRCKDTKRHFAIWRDPHPKPCYLFALVGGDLGVESSTFTTMSGRQVALNIYVEHGKEARAHWAMESLKRSMRWDEKRFGREYDLDIFNIVAVSDFNMGAMENKGLNVFNDRLILASQETANDTMFAAIESVVAHEYFHNWTGNRITCRDWFQLCLKEGLTVYRDQEFSADERSRTVQRIADVRQLKALQFPEDAGPLAHPVRPASYIEINNFYTPTVYEKGAELVRMIATILGEAGFRKGMDLYFERHDGDAATIEDFLAAFEDANGRDLSQFKLWYAQSGTPELVCRLTHDKSRKTAELKIEQVHKPTPGQTNKKPLHIPVRVGLLGANGKDVPLVLQGHGPLKDGVLQITKAKETFVFDEVPSRPVLSLMRGFSAPVKLALDLSDRDLEFLMAHDSDLFNRWQAANTYATRLLIESVAAMMAGKRSTRGKAFAKALGHAVANHRLEPAYRAELLRLPSQADIAREIARNVNHDLVFKAHRQLSKLVATTLGPDLEEIYAKSKPRGTFSPDAKSAGKRALRNAALTLLCARQGEEDRARLVHHFRSANNMTDEAHALFLLAGEPGPERQAALKRFRDKWQKDHLVIDTWFAAQAVAPIPETLERVETLTKHPLFDLKTPNKVRALIGNFALQNPSQFNRADGAGYQFVGRKVLEIDRFNPQVAARMLGTFRSWRALEAKRRSKARNMLRKIAEAPDLSRDSYEIVTKMLDS